MLLRISLAILLSAGVFATLGCGDDDEMPRLEYGSPCRNDAECGGRCARGEHYPGGMCTLACRNDGDCMAGALCVVDEGGICGFSCGGQSACLKFGPDYTCDAVSRRGTTGETLICRKP